MTDAVQQAPLLSELSKALCELHEEQFGAEPRSAWSSFAGPDVVVTWFSDALLPAEKAMVELGHAAHVQQARVLFQDATRDRFIETIERVMSRKIESFLSSCDARAGTVMEIAILEPRASDCSGDSAPTA